LLQLQSTPQQQQQQKGQFCFNWNEEGLKLFKLIINNLEKFDGGWVGGWVRERERGEESPQLCFVPFFFCFLSLLQSVFSATTFFGFIFVFISLPFAISLCNQSVWPISFTTVADKPHDIFFYQT